MASKKMNKLEYKAYCDWLFSIYPYCQVCENNLSQDVHHSHYGYFGAKRDDRYIVAICRDCHYQIHHGSYSNIPKDRREIEEIGRQNWRDYEASAR